RGGSRGGRGLGRPGRGALAGAVLARRRGYGGTPRPAGGNGRGARFLLLRNPGPSAASVPGGIRGPGGVRAGRGGHRRPPGVGLPTGRVCGHASAQAPGGGGAPRSVVSRAWASAGSRAQSAGVSRSVAVP